ncbi:MAG: GNAT family N-acetyltransferase [Theionarchaea archaeon]|nr:GNAT family N-acetyltransferase [Theionarchaea archaeon]MBU7036626.1 GNAT family N-acetyltransferase [Theionarchaea archaeon]
MIRKAVGADEEDLRRLCMAVNEKDYVLNLLSGWLKEGSLCVHEKEGAIVGMIRCTSSRDHQGHLGAVRVHPRHRRRGIAAALTEHCIAQCRAPVVRLAVVDNEASENLARKMGFTQVAVFTPLTHPLLDVSPVSYRAGTGKEALRLLRTSGMFKENASLLSTSFMFYTPTEELLDPLFVAMSQDQEHLIVVDFMVEEALGYASQIAYCDCDPQLVRAALYESQERGMKEVWAIIPKKDTVVNMLTALGFEGRGKTIKVFERQAE